SMGEAYDARRVAEALAKGRYQAVLMTHNETSSTVLNPIAEISALIRREQPEALQLVDSVSGLGTADLPVDKLGLDVVVAGSQKAFMLPPGLAYLAVSPRAWEAIAKAKAPRFYFDLLKARDFKAKGQTPWTPAISIFYAMQESVRSLREEGLENIFARHLRLAMALRAGVRALGLELLVKDDAIASRAVTGVWPPEQVAANDFRKLMNEQFGIVLANGQGPVQDKIFRIGHLGYCHPLDITGCLSALEIALRQLGAKLEFGASVAAAEESLARAISPQLITAAGHRPAQV
ncbi:MAG: aminotransferase class V-fold PLP-dependent enzyme, partial [Cyanobacteria bacterium REEB65]|nr:aminotransferase class V-fold PLP-dependent enzyme [Cyanobacteria bacterium REEB65]